MNPVHSDAIGSRRSAPGEQAGNGPDVRENPDAVANRPAPSVLVARDRQENRQLPLFLSLQPALGGRQAPDSGGTGVGPSTAIDAHRNASQPLLRASEATGIAGSPSAAGSGDPCPTGAASDTAYRRELAAWVASAQPKCKTAHQEAEARIHAYLKVPEEQRRRLDLSRLYFSTLPPLPTDLKGLDISNTNLKVLPENLPQGLQELDVQYTRLNVLPENLPQGLQKLDVNDTELGALPENLPQGLQELYVSGCINLNVLPENLPQGLQVLDVHDTNLNVLPKNLPQGLQVLDVCGTGLKPAALLAFMRTNTSITKLWYGHNDDPGSMRDIEHELENNHNHAARLANAAASLDLLTRFAFTSSAQTGMLRKRASMPDTAASGLPEQLIPAELHDVLAANSPKSLLSVLAGMTGDTRQ